MDKLQEALVRLQVIQNMADDLGAKMSLETVVELISSYIEEQKPKPNPEIEQKKASASFN